MGLTSFDVYGGRKLPVLFFAPLAWVRTVGEFSFNLQCQSAMTHNSLKTWKLLYYTFIRKNLCSFFLFFLLCSLNFSDSLEISCSANPWEVNRIFCVLCEKWKCTCQKISLDECRGINEGYANANNNLFHPTCICRCMFADRKTSLENKFSLGL